jgi:hypothetical protein
MKLFVMWEGSKEDDGDRDCVMKHAIDLAPDMMVGNYNASSDPDTKEQANSQWAQGKAGEDQVHVVLFEEHGWLYFSHRFSSEPTNLPQQICKSVAKHGKFMG